MVKIKAVFGEITVNSELVHIARCRRCGTCVAIPDDQLEKPFKTGILNRLDRTMTCCDGPDYEWPLFKHYPKTCPTCGQTLPPKD